MTSGGSGSDFIRRVIGDVAEQIDRLESLPEDSIPTAISGSNTSNSPSHEISYAVQVSCGTVGGALMGYFFGKVSKAAALATGGGILLLQTGVHLGYMSLGTTNLSQLPNRQDTTVQIRQNLRSVRNRIEPYLRTNPAFLSSLVAGLCLGYGIS